MQKRETLISDDANVWVNRLYMSENDGFSANTYHICYSNVLPPIYNEMLINSNRGIIIQNMFEHASLVNKDSIFNIIKRTLTMQYCRCAP